MFTGRVPFAHAEMMPLLMMHIERKPEPLRTVNSELPEELDAIVIKMMAKHPSDRFESLQHVTDALAQLRE
jgi:serine/threonine-protein kinase